VFLTGQTCSIWEGSEREIALRTYQKLRKETQELHVPDFVTFCLNSELR